MKNKRSFLDGQTAVSFFRLKLESGVREDYNSVVRRF